MKCSIEPQRQWLNSKQYFILNVRLQMPKHLTINHFRSAVMMICVAYCTSILKKKRARHFWEFCVCNKAKLA